MNKALIAAAIGGSLVLSACVTGVDSETKQALRTTLESVQELTDLWQERLDALDPEPELTLADTGAYSSGSSSLTQIVNGVLTQVTEQSIQIGGWGYWAKRDDDTLFRARLTATGTIRNGVPSQSYSSSVLGTRTGSNPASGSAVWTGGVRGVTEDFTRVTGESRLEADLSAVTIDVDFTSFDDGRADMSWDDLSLTSGAFRDGSALEGAFYGAEHEGIAGKFDRDGLRGVFGALRE